MNLPKTFIAILLLIFFSCSKSLESQQEISIIPQPQEITLNTGTFEFNSSTSLLFEEDFKNAASYFSAFIKDVFGHNLESSKNTSNIVSFIKDNSIENPEGYKLEVSTNKILIKSKSPKGAFYGVQSLIQLFKINEKNKISPKIQTVKIKDNPQFVYRGMHLDVGRHFYSVDFIKKYIDLLAQLKFNVFHWHLTEDQGWRIEIKKYPKLQEIAAYRNETIIGHNREQPQKFDGKRYGGYYTQEQIKEIVKYASERYVDVIPEIEMPGHSQAALAAYPELGCTGETISPATKWGVFEDIYCPKEITFTFLEDVIDEVVELFPSKYIHIGGDEAPKARWKKCKHCQKLIKKEGLKDEHELQSYFITRMEKYINSKGKQIIGWDEILEGGLAPNATVMSWRGIGGAVEAAKQGHDVILTPTSHCYFDYYQGDPKEEPTAIGGYLPLKKVYEFNPIPEALTKEERKYVLGAQGNVWTEYIPTQEQVEYMVFPRAIALSEVLWSSVETRDYENFVTRLIQFNKRLDKQNVNYGKHIYNVNGKAKTEKGKLNYALKTESGEKILFTTDGSSPKTKGTVYNAPFSVLENTVIKATTIDENGNQLGSVFEEKIIIHKAVGAKISIVPDPHKSYRTGTKNALINGVSGANYGFNDNQWLGFSGTDIEITLELLEASSINSITTRFNDSNGSWVYAPKEVEILFDGDSQGTYKTGIRENELVPFLASFEHKKAKTITLKIPFFGIIPEGKPGAGKGSWTFIDEIIIE